MADERRWLFARLAAERSELLHQLLRLNVAKLTQEPFLDSWTVKDLLAHIAAWDRWEHAQMQGMLGGEAPEDVSPDPFNAAVVAGWSKRSLDEVITEVRDARASWLQWLDGVPDELFFQTRVFDDWDWCFPNCMRIQWEHDAEHAGQIAAWRQGYRSEHVVGPKAILLAALEGARRELLTVAALIPRDGRASTRVCGAWTLKDVLGHLADWEKVGVEGLRCMALGRRPAVEAISDIDAWNADHAAARLGQSWDEVWTDFHGTRDDLMDILAGMAEARLHRWYRFPWGPRGTAYEWACVFQTHDREHACDIRAELEKLAGA